MSDLGAGFRLKPNCAAGSGENGNASNPVSGSCKMGQCVYLVAAPEKKLNLTADNPDQTISWLANVIDHLAGFKRFQNAVVQNGFMETLRNMSKPTPLSQNVNIRYSFSLLHLKSSNGGHCQSYYRVRQPMAAGKY